MIEAARIDWNKGRVIRGHAVANYMSALCETGARPGYFDRFPRRARTFLSTAQRIAHGY